MTATAKTTRKTIAQLLAEQAENLVPANGDCGLVVGATYPGELQKVKTSRRLLARRRKNCTTSSTSTDRNGESHAHCSTRSDAAP